MSIQIQLRRGTASEWTTSNPILASGEIGFETDTLKGKVGNGSSTWSSLSYVFISNSFANPMTAVGDIIYGTTSGTATNLAGNTTSTKKFLRQTGTGIISAAPAWDTLVDGDIPTALTGKSYNGLTLTSTTGTFTLTAAKILSVSNTITLTGTDGVSINLGATNGTLGSAAFTATSAYEPAITTLAISKGGTGTQTAPTQYGLIYATSATAYASTAAGASTQVLIGNAAGSPTWTNISGLTVSSASTATTATNLSGTTQYSLPYQSASATTGYVAVGTAGQALVSAGAAAPAWTTLTLENLPDAWVKKSVRVATTTALGGTYANGTAGVGATLTITSTATLDGVTLANGDRILVKDQATTFQNGIYTRTSATVLTRATDADAPGDISSGLVGVDEGTVSGGSVFTTYFKATDTIGTTAIVWSIVVDTSQFGTGISTFLATPSSANLATAVTGETGSGALVFGTSPTVSYLALAAGTATASQAPLKFTSGTNLTTAEAGAVEYDGTVATITPSTNFGRAPIATPIITSGAGTSGITLNTNYALFPTAADTITLPLGTYAVQMSFLLTVTTSTVASVLNMSIRGAGTAVGTFSWNGMGVAGTGTSTASAPTQYSAVQQTAVATAITIAPTSATNPRTYFVTGTGILRITTAGTIIPAYQFAATLTSGTVTFGTDNYLMITPLSSSGTAVSTGAWA